MIDFLLGWYLLAAGACLAVGLVALVLGSSTDRARGGRLIVLGAVMIAVPYAIGRLVS